MTKKEKEILEIIRANPTVEQSEIADALNISRSTVAVHISSLQRQGFLLGKGYIVNDEEYIVGIGACNIDIYGASDVKIRTHYDHPGKIVSNIGGVMHNIIRNYTKLSGKAKLITAYGDDGFGKIIADRLRNENIDMNDSLMVKDCSSGIFMQVQDENNDMYLAICDMTVISHLTPEYIEEKKNVITRSRLVVLDPSLPLETIEKIIEICRDKVEIYVDPISENYAHKIKPYLSDLSFIKPNLTELSALSGMKIDTEEHIKEACRKVLETGLKSILVSRGKDGVIYMDNDVCIARSLPEEKHPVNMSGAGDGLMAAFIYGQVSGESMERCIDLGLASGIAAIRSKETINDDLSVELLDKILKEKRK